MKRRTLRAGLLGAMLMAASASAAWALDINTATVADLESLGFSPTVATNIVADRPTGGYLTTGSVLAVPGVTQGMLNKVRASLTIDGKHVTTPSGTTPAIPGVSAAIPGNPKALVHRDTDDTASGAELGEGTEHGAGGSHAGGNGGGNGGGHGNGHGK